MLQTEALAPGTSPYLLDLFIVEAVDEWVEGWCDKGAEQRCHLVTVQGIAGAGMQVHENECPYIMAGHSCEVGSLDRAHAHHSASNEVI